MVDGKKTGEWRWEKEVQGTVATVPYGSWVIDRAEPSSKNWPPASRLSTRRKHVPLEGQGGERPGMPVPDQNPQKPAPKSKLPLRRCIPTRRPEIVMTLC